MSCCGSNRSSTFSGGSSTATFSGELLSRPDGELAPLHPSWLDGSIDPDLSKIPPSVTREVVAGVVTLTINPGPNQFVIRSGEADRRIMRVKRQRFWGMYPALTESIVKPAPVAPASPSVEPEPVLPVLNPPKKS